MSPAETSATEDFLTIVSGSFVCSRRQHDAEHTPRPFLALQFEATAVHLHRPACGRQAEPCASSTSRPPLIDTVEALEDAFAMNGGNPGPGVPDLDRAFAGRCSSHDDLDHALPRGVLDRVVEHVD